MSEDSEASLVLTVSAETLPHRIHGQLSIEKHSETHYSVIFCSVDEYTSVDIDCVYVDVKEKTVNMREPQAEDQILERSYFVPDRGHLQLFQEAQSDCQLVCNLFLELNSRFRDVYYAALYSELGVHQTSTIDEELERLQVLSMGKLEREIAGEDESENTKPIAASSTVAKFAKNAKQTATVECFYCSKNNTEDDVPDFFNHPYVPLNFDKKHLYMCSICLDNWREYRETAKQDKQLILTGEINEEVCALCSDTPDVLVLCSGCQRSFCNDCLRKVLGSTLYESVVNNNEINWRCMSCSNKITAKPILSRDVWISWKKIELFSSTVESSSNFKRVSSSAVAAGALNGSVGKTKKSVVALSPPPKRQRGALAPAPSVSSKAKASPPPTAPHSSAARAKTQSKPPSATANKGKVKKEPDQTPLQANVDEVFYFAQYCNYLEESLRLPKKIASNSKAAVHEMTDDACFLCKDGGEVIECDFCFSAPPITSSSTSANSSISSKNNSRKKTNRCLKVYHTYCLDFAVPDTVAQWLCPRHFCSACGSKDALRFVCVFCPLTLCRNCPATFAEKYQRDTFFLMPQVPASHSPYADATLIACDHCAEMLRRAELRPDLLEARQFLVLGDQCKYKETLTAESKRDEAVHSTGSLGAFSDEEEDDGDKHNGVEVAGEREEDKMVVTDEEEDAKSINQSTVL